MREHKYKAWNRETKTMWWFDLAWGDFAYGKGSIGMLPMDELNRSSGNRDNRIAVDPNYCALLEYTGLKDKQGKEIYEGDIAKCFSFGDELPFKCDVFYNENIAAFQIRYMGANDHYVFDTLCADKLEVIGNIHENPDLKK